ncbi:Pol, partial [Candida maltosa Xu316]
MPPNKNNPKTEPTTGNQSNPDEFRANVLQAFEHPSMVEYLTRIIQQAIRPAIQEAEADTVNYVASVEEQSKQEILDDVHQITQDIANKEMNLESREKALEAKEEELEAKTATLEQVEKQFQQETMQFAASKNAEMAQMQEQIAVLTQQLNDVQATQANQPNQVVTVQRPVRLERDVNFLIKTYMPSFIILPEKAPQLAAGVINQSPRYVPELIINGSDDLGKLSKLSSLERHFSGTNVPYIRWGELIAPYLNFDLKTAYLNAERVRPGGGKLTWREVVELIAASGNLVLEDMAKIERFCNLQPKPDQLVKDYLNEAEARSQDFSNFSNKHILVRSRVYHCLGTYFRHIIQSYDLILCNKLEDFFKELHSIFSNLRFPSVLSGDQSAVNVSQIGSQSTGPPVRNQFQYRSSNNNSSFNQNSNNFNRWNSSNPPSNNTNYNNGNNNYHNGNNNYHNGNSNYNNGNNNNRFKGNQWRRRKIFRNFSKNGRVTRRINVIRFENDDGDEFEFAEDCLEQFPDAKIDQLQHSITATTASNIQHSIHQSAEVLLPPPFSIPISFLILPHLQQIIIGKPTLRTWNYALSDDTETITINNQVIEIESVATVPFNSIKLDLESLRQKLRDEIFHQYTELFDTTPRSAAQRIFQYDLITTSEVPIRCRAYPAGPEEKKAIEAFITEKLKAGVLVENVKDPWYCPIFAVRQKDLYRIVNDLRKLNAVTVLDVAYLSTFKDLMVMLAKSRYYTVFDLKSAFHQIGLTPRSIQKMGIISHLGIHNFTSLPFGAKCAPYILAKFLQGIFGSMENLFIYMDDILIMTSTLESHIQLVHKVCHLLNSNHLQANIKKVQLLQEQITFLGYQISHDKIQPTADKLKAIQSWSLPETTTEIRSFVNFVNYFHLLIPNVSRLTSKLTALTAGEGKRIPINHTEESRAAFETLKHQLINIPYVHHYDPSQPVHILVDTSDQAVGAIITQQRMVDGQDILVPICYVSYSLNEVQRRYSSMEKESLGMLIVIRKYEYLLGTQANIYSDHQSLSILQSRTVKPPLRISRFLDVLGCYSPLVYYLPGKNNFLADILSRHQTKNINDQVDEASLLGDEVVPIENIRSSSINSIALDNLNESNLQQIKDHLMSIPPPVVNHVNEDPDDESPIVNEFSDTLPVSYFAVLEDRLFVTLNNNKVVPVVSREEFLDEATKIHQSFHASIRVINYIAIQKIWHPDHLLLCTEVVRNCNTCTIHGSFREIARELVSLEPTTAFHRWAFDYTHAGAESHGYRNILVAVEYVTSLTYAIAVKNADTKSFLSLLTLIIQAHDVPKQIITDNGSPFVSEDAKKFLQEWKITPTTASNYHPMSNGKVEKTNHLLKNIIKGLTNKTWQDWYTLLPKAVNILNNTPSMFGKSPYFLAYGKDATINSPIEIHDLEDISVIPTIASSDTSEESVNQLNMIQDDVNLRLHDLDLLMQDREEHNNLKKRRDAMRNLLLEPYGTPAVYSKGQWVYRQKTEKKET